MSLVDLPASAAWRHRGAHDGYEAVFIHSDDTGYRLDGHTVATEEDRPWVVRYAITLNQRWMTTEVRVWGWSPLRSRTVLLATDPAGHWTVNDAVVPELDGCIDVDLESSCCTNTIPVHRLQLGVGQSADAPAAYIRALDLSVQRLEQRYSLIDNGASLRYDYHAPAFDFRAVLVYDESGLIIEYPGIGSRVL